MRALMVVPPLAGHILPLAALARTLTDAGHDVAWAGFRDAIAPLVPDEATILDLDSPLSAEDYDALRAKGRGLRGARAFQFLFQDLFFPLADAMRPGVEAAARDWAADVLVVDQQTYAGALAARRLGLPFVTSAATSANLVDPFAALPKLRQWWQDGLVDLQRRHGLDGDAHGLLGPDAVIAWSTRDLVGPAEVPPQTVFVGPALARAGRRAVDFPWDRLRDDVPKVLVSLGTVNAEIGGRFFAVACEALRDLPVQAVLVAPDDLVHEPPPGAIVQSFVPQLELLERVDAVVGHGGHNTTVEALAEGLPLVIAPIRDDQPVVAQQVVEAGAGIRVRFGRVKADKLRRAITEVLDDGSYRDAARRLAAGFRVAGGPAEAARIVVGVGRDRCET